MPDPIIIPVGLFVGILISAPVGPVNIICINRALRFGFWSGVAVGAGALVADGLLASAAGFGVTAATEVISHHDVFIQLVGGVVLILFGLIVMLRTPRPDPAKGAVSQPWLRSMAAAFVLTVTNPGAMLGFLAIFSGLIGREMVPEGDYVSAGLLVVSVMAGAALWWIGLSMLISRVRHTLSAHTLHLINLVSGIALTVFGAVLLLRVLVYYFF